MAVKKDTPPASAPSQASSHATTEDLVPPPPSYEEASSSTRGPSSNAPSSSARSEPSTIVFIPSESSHSPLLPRVHHSDPSALELANRRARKRILGAMLYAFAIWFVVGGLLGGSAAVMGTNETPSGSEGRHSGHRHRTYDA